MHGQIMNGSDSVVVFGIINITKCFKYMNSCPGLWHALRQWDNLHYHNVLLELFFLRIHYHMQNKWIYMTLLMRFNWKQLPMWWNKWTGWGVIFWHEGNKNESTTFYIWCWAQIIDLQRISVECILKNHQRKKPWDPYQLIATVLLNEVDFFLHESMRNMMARDSFLHLRLSLLINAL